MCNSYICFANVHKHGHHIYYGIIYSLVNAHRTIHMDAYVGVTNDVSLAVKSILQVKKAFLTQKKCFDVLTKENKSLKQRICQLEKRNNDMKNKLTRLESDNKKQEQIVSDLIRGANGADVFSDVLVIDNHNVSLSGSTSECVNRDIPGVNVKSEHTEKLLCPSSPTTSNKQRSKRKVTPEKKTPPRKSRRLSDREQKSQSICF